MRTLLVDNYDSYTYNLAELISRVSGVDPLVLRNDAIDPDEVDRLGVAAVVLSPGPGAPHHARDVGAGPRLLRRTRLPVLGVCLGHQMIAYQLGATVTASHPAHGRVSTVRLAGDPLFAGMPERIQVVRYHSLSVAEPLPPRLRRIAVAEDGAVMAIRVRDAPRWGVQFHPEAACTEYGEMLLANFLRCADPGGRTGRWPARCPAPAAGPGRAGTSPAAGPGLVGTSHRVGPGRADRKALALATRTISPAPSAPAVFDALYRHRRPAFWLDTSALRESHGWSFLGALDGDLDHLLTAAGATVTVTDSAGRTTSREVDSVWRYLRQRLEAYTVRGGDGPPLRGGYVGYLGYGLPTATIAAARPSTGPPDLALLFVTRFIAIDHARDRLLACAVHDATGRAAAADWLDATCAALRDLPPAGPDRPPAPVAPDRLDAALVGTALTDPAGYRAAVRRCIEEIRRGESYEICLTTGFTGTPLADPYRVYRALRRVNPAPYGGYLDLGTVQLLSSSPERFLRIQPDGRVESRPIKGTSPRGRDPAEDAWRAAALAADPKARAENMMIVDLLRNDLNRVCAVGSVAVDALMRVESYETVHQLVSAVTGRLRPAVHPVQAVESCFPGGSMTGAPKLRTMEIISALEPHARGVYSGAAGLFSLDGYVDLAIVIRSIVNHPSGWFVGAGGAVLAGSDPEAEYQEMRHKAAPALTAILAAGAG